MVVRDKPHYTEKSVCVAKSFCMDDLTFYRQYNLGVVMTESLPFITSQLQASRLNNMTDVLNFQRFDIGLIFEWLHWFQWTDIWIITMMWSVLFLSLNMTLVDCRWLIHYNDLIGLIFESLQWFISMRSDSLQWFDWTNGIIMKMIQLPDVWIITWLEINLCLNHLNDLRRLIYENVKDLIGLISESLH